MRRNSFDNFAQTRMDSRYDSNPRYNEGHDDYGDESPTKRGRRNSGENVGI